MIPPRRFYMIRHGETVANATRVMAGSVDSPLTELGKAQAGSAQALLASLPVPPTRIICSPLSRARDTALIINEALNLPLTEDPDLAEMHAGAWEGKPWEECADLLERWTDPPDGEKTADFLARIQRVKNRILNTCSGMTLIVSHGGVFRALAKLYQRDIWGVRNCHLHEFSPLDRAPDKASGSEPVHDFPWQVYTFDAHEKGIRKNLSDSFHS